MKRLPASWRGADTLAARLARTLLLWVGGCWLLSVLGVVWYVGREIDHHFDNELVEITHRLFPIALEHLGGAAQPPGPEAAPRLFAAPESFADADLPYRLVTPAARVLALSAPARTLHFDVPLAPGFANSGAWRIYTLRHPQQALFLQVADPIEERSAAVRRTLLGLTVPLLAVLPLLALLLRQIARRELRVLAQLAQEIGQRNGQQLAPITLGGLPRELARVQEHVNHLLERLALALDVERALAANAAHELRTPLAAARLRLQTALEHGLARPDVEAALDALQTLSRRTEKLLQLSRAESSAPLAREPVDLRQLATSAAQEFWAQDEGAARLELVLPDDPIVVQGDFDALAMALRNLLENALRHAPQAPVELIVGPGARLTVRDHGPGAPPGQLERLQQRHERLSSARAGYGLGLAIVRTIVHKHGGQLRLGSPLGDGSSGLQACITLDASCDPGARPAPKPGG